MASKKTRTRNHRRDRRKAKESGWKRPGKSNSKKVGHGGSGSTQQTIVSRAVVVVVDIDPREDPKRKFPLRATIGELIK